jgi:hypothetical protein
VEPEVSFTSRTLTCEAIYKPEARIKVAELTRVLIWPSAERLAPGRVSAGIYAGWELKLAGIQVSLFAPLF